METIRHNFERTSPSPSPSSTSGGIPTSFGSIITLQKAAKTKKVPESKKRVNNL